MTFGSLFSGVGGFDLGFERAGMKCVWQVENDKYCTRVLERHWPHVARFGDVREFEPGPGERCDLICGGFPCQDLSVAGKRAGLEGKRSGLFWDAIRVVSVLRPRWIVMENVPGLLSANGGRDMGAVVGAFQDAGYSCCWRTLDARWFGVAQRRRRVFIVGHADARCAGAVLFEPESGARHPAKVRKAGTDIAHAVTCSTTRTGRLDANGETFVAATLNSGDHKGGFRTEPGERLAHCLRARHAASEDGTGRGTPLVAMPEIESVQQQRSEDGGRDVAYACTTHHRGIREAWNSTFACAPSNPDRMREVDGLPSGLDSARYRCCGNAVVVPVAEWIGRRIVGLD